ncbi:MAG: universal stress protein, partial [Desulfovibrionaceae bacterium]
MYTKLLIALDDSPCSSHALQQGLTLAASEGAGVELVSVVPAYDGDLRLMGDKRALTAMREPHERVLEAASQRAAAAGVRATATLLEGDPVERILTRAETSGAQLIVLGKCGNCYTDLVPVGSVAAKTARLAEADVLLVPLYKDLRLHHVLAPVDGSPLSLHAAARATGLAASYGSRLSFLTVYELPLEGFVHNPGMDLAFADKTVALHQGRLEKAGPAGAQRAQALVRQGVPAHRLLLEFLREEDCGLVVMGCKGVGRFSK